MHRPRPAQLFVVRKRGRARGPSDQSVVLPVALVAARSSTRGCSPRRSSPSSSPTSATSASSRRSRWCTSRFSTNTFPSWPLAHPYRYIAHNGEINTVQGNRNWMRAREALLETPTASRATSSASSRSARRARRDTASFDEVLELLHLGGRSLPHAVLMMIPEAWENHDVDDAGEARVLPLPRLADGAVGRPGVDRVHRRHGDRRGARPQRPAAEPLLGHRRRPRDHGERGRRGRHRSRRRSCRRAGCSRAACSSSTPPRAASSTTTRSRRASPPSSPTTSGSTQGLVHLDDLPEREHVVYSHESVLRRQQMFGYTHEELKILVAPMASDGRRGDRLDGHRHADRRAVRPAAAAVRLLPAAVRPGHQPAARRHPRGAGHVARSARSGRRATCSTPAPAVVPAGRAAVPDHRQRRAGQAHPHQRRRRPARASRRRDLTGCTASPAAAPALREALDTLRREVSEAIAEGARILVLSDRDSTDELRADPVAAARPSAVHHHLIREKTRTQVGLVVEAGDAREVHHMALLIGYGAGAINPYLAFESIEDLIAEGLHGLGGIDPHKAVKNYIKAAGKGVLKVMSKMGISTVASLHAARRSSRRSASASELVDEYFTGTVSRARRHRPRRARRRGRRSPRDRRTRPTPTSAPTATLELGGEYQWRREGEYHLFNPETVFKLQHATRAQALRHLQGVHEARRRPVAATRDAARPVRRSTLGDARRRSRSTRSSRSARSSSGSRPARCPTARSRRRPTRPSPSR